MDTVVFYSYTWANILTVFCIFGLLTLFLLVPLFWWDVSNKIGLLIISVIAILLLTVLMHAYPEAAKQHASKYQKRTDHLTSVCRDKYNGRLGYEIQGGRYQTFCYGTGMRLPDNAF